MRTDFAAAEARQFPPSEECGKRKFTSPRHARMAHTKAGFRIRAYWCAQCRAFHATNSEKH